MSSSNKQLVNGQNSRSTNTSRRKRVKTQRRAILLAQPCSPYPVDGSHTFQQTVRATQIPLINPPSGSVSIQNSEADFLARISKIVPSSFDIVKRGNLPALSLN